MWTLRPLPFSDLAGWAADDHGAALSAFARHANRPMGETYRREMHAFLERYRTDLKQLRQSLARRIYAEVYRIKRK